jgi:cysteinyl-tRNA synthetase
MRRLKSLCTKYKVPIVQIFKGDKVIIDNIEFNLLYPAKVTRDDNENNLSMLLKVMIDDTTILFTGDLEETAENKKFLSIWERYDLTKKEHPEHIAMIRVGDFYEFFYDDAKKVASVLDLTLTSRQKDENERVPMCGVPYHALERYLQKILDAGYAYVSEGSVYFDVEKYNKDYNYGKLSGRNIEELLETTRELDGQSEKRRSMDFALWKKAQPEHIMRWPSPWSDGFPGWHMECSAMGCKYLGEEFDIHGGGMDLMFPHHECEIAQSTAALGKESVHYWMHNNMITINGQKMGKSLGNFITLEELFTGNHKLLAQAYSPMTIRFFILQAHYRSTVDFSNEALQASEKGLQRLMEAYERLTKLTASNASTVDVKGLREKCDAAMNDDLNSPIAISHLFDACKAINSISDGKATISAEDLEELKSVFKLYIEDIFGLKADSNSEAGSDAYKKAIDLLLNIRLEAKRNKDWGTSDKIRNELTALGFSIKDTKDGFEWSL